MGSMALGREAERFGWIERFERRLKVLRLTGLNERLGARAKIKRGTNERI